MGKVGLVLTSVLVLVMASLIMPNEAADIGKYLYESAPQKISQTADALYAIPPTPSWTTIEIDNNQVNPINNNNIITASNYTDKFYLVSDGSILINITEFSP